MFLSGVAAHSGVRMLKMASAALSVVRPSTYIRTYASVSIPAALLQDHFEHPRWKD